MNCVGSHQKNEKKFTPFFFKLPFFSRSIFGEKFDEISLTMLHSSQNFSSTIWFTFFHFTLMRTSERRGPGDDTITSITSDKFFSSETIKIFFSSGRVASYFCLRAAHKSSDGSRLSVHKITGK